MSKYCYLKRVSHWQPLLALLVLISFAHMASAQVYKCESDAGNIIFSDEPCKKGEYSTRLNWLKTKPSGQKSRKASDSVSSRAKKTARKAKRNNEAYVLLSLLTTTQLELETASLRSSLRDEETDGPELILSDGITVDLLKVDKMLMSSSLGKNKMRVRFIMNDGYEEEKIITRPYPVITGEAKIGRFSKSLDDIKRIEFFNSEKLLKARGDKLALKKRKKSRGSKKTDTDTKSDETPVIELDLSHEVRSEKTFVPKVRPVTAKKTAKDTSLPVKKLTPNNVKQTSKPPSEKRIPVVFSNDKKTSLIRSSLGSSRGSQTTAGQQFILNDREHIPFDKIKSIRVRPTGDKNKLVVAVALKTGEIKMENMSQPFTRIQGETGSGRFNYSLLEIKSISFQR